VGQGDAALITTAEGRRILIDAGPGADVVADLLAGEGVDTLDLVIASHNHADHIGGMPEVLRRFVVRAYVENGLPHTTSIYARTVAALEREPDLQYLAAVDRTITVGSVTVRILPPPHLDDSQNNNSVGALLEYGRFRALYTGDSEIAELRSWLRTARIPRVTIVKVAHHGSSNGTAAEWVRATAPVIALFSLASRNSYGHPSPGVETAWTSVGAQVHRTDREGTIDIAATADGSVTVGVSVSRRRAAPVR
jgi:beta-lactamase superfamily II metal-dependent hydrolase